MKHYTLTIEDVDKPHLKAFGRVWPVSGFLGRILPNDVGKHVYLRGGILQIENDEQRKARVAADHTSMFDDDVAWLQFLADLKERGCGPLQDIDRITRIAFNWARRYPKGQSTPMAKTDRLCQALHNHNSEDYDAMRAAPRCGCPTGCGVPAVLHLFLVTSYVHETPRYDDVATVFCEPCGEDALESGQYCAGDDLLEGGQ